MYNIICNKVLSRARVNLLLFTALFRPGILDTFLSVIAKTLTLQVKMRGKSGSGGASKEISTVTLGSCLDASDDTGLRWWLRGATNRKLSEVMIQLITDMSAVRLEMLQLNGRNNPSV